MEDRKKGDEYVRFLWVLIASSLSHSSLISGIYVLDIR